MVLCDGCVMIVGWFCDGCVVILWWLCNGCVVIVGWLCNGCYHPLKWDEFPIICVAESHACRKGELIVRKLSRVTGLLLRR